LLLAREVSAATVLPELKAAHQTVQEIMALDPKNARWIRREAVARTRLATALFDAGETATAAKETEAALAPLKRLYASNQEDVTGRAALIDALLLLSAIQRQQKNDDLLIRTCTQVHALIKDDSASTMSYQILVPWIHVNACLQDRSAAQAGVKRLEQIGYRDQSYLRFITSL
jgi:hypothetical protein